MTEVDSSMTRHPAGAGATAVSAMSAPPVGVPSSAPASTRVSKPLYTPEQRRRRDATRWTLVQGILAPLQLLAMLVSVGLVLRYLSTGEGLVAANVSVVVKTLFLYVIMVTGAIWEKVVFDQYLFHEAFFWEDVVSFGVIAVHTIYLWGLFAGWDPRANLTIALIAYAIYTVNAMQFLLKLRAARRLEADMNAAAARASGAEAVGATTTTTALEMAS
jgi:3-vinyl bacteriochlorophyllide hydratase